MEKDKTTKRSTRKEKRKQFFDNGTVSHEEGGKFRACEKAGCPACRPTCCARFDETWVILDQTCHWPCKQTSWIVEWNDFMYLTCKNLSDSLEFYQWLIVFS